MNPSIHRPEHFFVYMPCADTENVLPTNDSVIGCQKVKAEIDGKSKSVVVFTRIPISEFNQAAWAKKSATEDADAGELSRTENPKDSDVGLRIIKKSMKIPPSWLSNSGVMDDGKPKKI
jgi:hypothetical protein